MINQETIITALSQLRKLGGLDHCGAAAICPIIIESAHNFLIDLSKLPFKLPLIIVEPIADGSIRLGWKVGKKRLAEVNFMKDYLMWVMVDRSQTVTAANEFRTNQTKEIIEFIYDEK